LPVESTVPMFDTGTDGRLGNFHGLAVHHAPGVGGTFLLAMMSLVATGAGWDTWVVAPKATDADLYFPHCSRHSTANEIAAMLQCAAAMIADRTPRSRPLLLTIDLGNHVFAGADAPTRDALDSIITNGPAAGVVVNIGFTQTGPELPASDALRALTHVRLVGERYLHAEVAGRPCLRPQLFVDYLLLRDRSDVDYRRYLQPATTLPHYPDNAYSRLAADLVARGVPHAWGGGTVDGPTPSLTADSDPLRPGFDAGSLAQYLHHQADRITLLRTTCSQYGERGAEVSAVDAAPGDLIWPADTSEPYTVATYLGGDAAVDAGNDPNGYVRIVKLSALGPVTITRPTA